MAWLPSVEQEEETPLERLLRLMGLPVPPRVPAPAEIATAEEASRPEAPLPDPEPEPPAPPDVDPAIERARREATAAAPQLGDPDLPPNVPQPDPGPMPDDLAAAADAPRTFRPPVTDFPPEMPQSPPPSGPSPLEVLAQGAGAFLGRGARAIPGLGALGDELHRMGTTPPRPLRYGESAASPPAPLEYLANLARNAAPPGWTADQAPPEGLDLALNAIPALPVVPAIGVRGVGPWQAMAADLASNLLGGPSVASLDGLLRPAAQGVRLAADSLAGVDAPRGGRTASRGGGPVNPLAGGADDAARAAADAAGQAQRDAFDALTRAEASLAQNKAAATAARRAGDTAQADALTAERPALEQALREAKANERKAVRELSKAEAPIRQANRQAAATDAPPPRPPAPTIADDLARQPGEFDDAGMDAAWEESQRLLAERQRTAPAARPAGSAAETPASTAPPRAPEAPASAAASGPPAGGGAPTPAPPPAVRPNQTTDLPDWTVSGDPNTTTPVKGAMVGEDWFVYKGRPREGGWVAHNLRTAHAEGAEGGRKIFGARKEALDYAKGQGATTAAPPSGAQSNTDLHGLFAGGVRPLEQDIAARLADPQYAGDVAAAVNITGVPANRLPLNEQVWIDVARRGYTDEASLRRATALVAGAQQKGLKGKALSDELNRGLEAEFPRRSAAGVPPEPLVTPPRPPNVPPAEAPPPGMADGLTPPPPGAAGAPPAGAAGAGDGDGLPSPTNGRVTPEAPAEPPEGTREHRFAPRVIADEDLAPEVREAVAFDPRRFYEPLPNTESAARAKARLDADLEGELERFLNNAGPPSAEEGMTGQVLIRRLAEMGRHADAVEVNAQLMNRHLLAGQFIQTAARLGDLTPEGILLTAQKMKRDVLGQGRSPHLTPGQSEKLAGEVLKRMGDADDLKVNPDLAQDIINEALGDRTDISKEQAQKLVDALRRAVKKMEADPKVAETAKKITEQLRQQAKDDLEQARKANAQAETARRRAEDALKKAQASGEQLADAQKALEDARQQAKDAADKLADTQKATRKALSEATRKGKAQARREAMGAGSDALANLSKALEEGALAGRLPRKPADTTGEAVIIREIRKALDAGGVQLTEEQMEPYRDAIKAVAALPKGPERNAAIGDLVRSAGDELLADLYTAVKQKNGEKAAEQALKRANAAMLKGFEQGLDYLQSAGRLPKKPADAVDDTTLLLRAVLKSADEAGYQMPQEMGAAWRTELEGIHKLPAEQQHDALRSSLRGFAQRFWQGQIDAALQGKSRLTPEEAKRLSKMAQQLGELQEGPERIAGTLVMLRELWNLVPASFWRKLSSARIGGLLFNPLTHMVNIVGNTGMAAADVAVRTVGTPLDILVSLRTGQRTVTRPHPVEQVKAFGKGLAGGVKEGWTGLPTGAVQHGDKFELDIPLRQTFPSMSRTFSKDASLKERAAALLQSPFRAMEVGNNVALRGMDRAFYESASADERLAQVYLIPHNRGLRGDELLEEQARLLLKPTVEEEKAIAEAMDARGLYTTLNNDTVWTRISRLVKDVGNAIPGLSGGRERKVGYGPLAITTREFGAGDFLNAFPRVPVNLMTVALSYSPAGLLRSVLMDGGMLLFRGDVMQQRQFVERFTRGLIGTAGLTIPGYYLAQSGALIPPDLGDVKTKEFYRQQGLEEGSLNLSAIKRWMANGMNPAAWADALKPQKGDSWGPIGKFQPFSTSMLMGAQFGDSLKRTRQKIGRGEGSLADYVGPLAAAITAPMDAAAEFADLALGTLGGFAAVPMVKRLTQGDNATEAFLQVLTDAPASFVPTLAAQMAGAIDQSARDPYDEELWKEAVNKVMNRVPLMTGYLNRRVGVTGEVMPRVPAGKPGISLLFDPVRAKEYLPTAAQEILRELYEASGDRSVIPPLAPKTMRLYENEAALNDPNAITRSVKLTDKERLAFQEERGKRIGALAKDLMESPEFRGAPPDQQRTLVREMLRKVENETDTLTRARSSAGMTSEPGQSRLLPPGAEWKPDPAQLMSDERVAAGTLSKKDWIKERSDRLLQASRAKLTQMGVPLPANFGQDDARRYVVRLLTAAAVTDDPKVRGQILAAAYSAVPASEKAQGVRDLDTLTSNRDAFEQALRPEDRRALQTALESRMTPLEKEYDAIRRGLRPYWEVPDEVAKQPKYQALVAQHDTATVEQREQIEKMQAWKNYEKAVAEAREKMRKSSKAVDRMLVEWYGYQPVDKKKTGSSSGGGFFGLR